MVYRTTEYGVFTCEKKRGDYTALNQKEFAALENFILSNSVTMPDFMGISMRKGLGKVITAKNYVGVIAFSDGNMIEILPKIYSENDGDPRKLLSDMLKTLNEAPYKSLQNANIALEKTSVLEIFIKMYIDEIYSIVKRGLNSGYETVCENLNFFKGKIKFGEQVKYNYAHKERSYSEFDVFSPNRPENRIIKSTLRLLYRIAAHHKNKSDLRTLLELFSDVDLSENFEADFARIILDRNNKKYETALEWSRIFLRGESFSAFAGSQITLALLFPMEKLFECYIAALLRKDLDKTDYKISVQDRRYSLFDDPKKFSLCPDIVIENLHNNEIFIMDTKWKLLSDKKRNLDISQADMYQMYAYSKKYSAPNVTVIYPLTENVSGEPVFYSDDDVAVRIKFVDLYNAKESIKEILSSVVYDTNLSAAF